MNVQLHSNEIIIELDERDAKLANKVFPLMRPMLTDSVKDVLALSLIFVVSLREFIDTFKRTGAIDIQPALQSFAKDSLAAIHNTKTIELPSFEELMKIAEIDIKDIEEGGKR